MDELLADLRYDYNFQIYLFNSLVKNLKPHEQAMAIAWVNKLKNVSGTIQETQLRNDFVYYLVHNCMRGELKAPFRDQPPKGPLINIKYLLPDEPCASRNKTSGEKKKRTKICELFDKSPDKGEFLAAQPVPRCGAFCYLAVISRPPPE